MVSFLVELPASPVHDQHLPPGLRTLASDLPDVLFDRDVRLSSMLRYEVACLSGEVCLVCAEPSEVLNETEQILDLRAIRFEWRGYLEGEDEQTLYINYEVKLEKVFAFPPPLRMPNIEPSDEPVYREAGAIYRANSS